MEGQLGVKTISLTQAASNTLISKFSVPAIDDSDREATPLMNRHDAITINRESTDVITST